MLYVGYTMLSISHNSWGSVLAGDYDERSKIFGWREIFIILGMALVLAIPAALDLSRETPISEKLAAMGMFCLVLFPLTVLPTVLGVPDKPSVRTETLGLQDALELVRSNPTLWRLLLADFTYAEKITPQPYLGIEGEQYRTRSSGGHDARRVSSLFR